MTTQRATLNSWERPGMEIPPTVRAVFACAVYDFGRSGIESETIRATLQKQYLTEAFFVEAVLAVYEYNEWSLPADVKKKFRKVFRDKGSNLPART